MVLVYQAKRVGRFGTVIFKIKLISAQNAF